MCGINGFSWGDEKLVSRMNAAVKHRGPDDEGSFSDERVSLGQVRLSIIELSEKGHNPLGIDGKNNLIYRDSKLGNADLIIVFNGEIYNFLELRKLIGGKFYSGSDTEVILRAYKKWGTGCVRKFNGMWSFALYDKKEKMLFCSRDRLGVKPFYYYYDGKDFAFSSELKGLLSAKKLNKKSGINKEAVELYFSLGFIPSPMTIYNDAYKLEGGHSLIFHLDRRSVEKVKYYELPDYKPVKDRKKLVEEGRKILYDATRLRMIADVPVGAFLSGGLDSSSIVGAMSKYTDLKNLHTFSIGFEKKYDHGRYDETRYMNLVKDHFGTIHHNYLFTERNFEKILDRFPFMYDEPFWDYSGFPTYKVSEMARKYVTVVLSGDGGDEIFGGYASHLMGARMDLLRKTPKALRKILSRLPVKKNFDSAASLFLLKEAMALSLKKKKSFYAESLRDGAYKPEVYRKWTEDKLRYSLGKGGNSLAEGLRVYDLLFGTLQDNFLVKVDRASMQAPVEVRSPFLDYRFVEFAQRIPTKWKATPGKTKVLMREIIKGIVPGEIVNRGKQGFEPPLDKWIRRGKYEKYMKKRLPLLKSFSPELYGFYAGRVFRENGRFYSVYRIKLFLFLKWWDKWIAR